MSDYGFSDRISQALARGISKTGVGVEMIDLRSADAQDVNEVVSRSIGIVIGMPPSSGKGSERNSRGPGHYFGWRKSVRKPLALFESYGGDDEPIDTLQTKLQDLDLKVAFDPIRVKDTPGESIYQLCEETGTDLGQDLAKVQKRLKKSRP